MKLIFKKFRQQQPGLHEDIDEDTSTTEIKPKPPRFQPIAKKLIKPKRQFERELFEIIQLDLQQSPAPQPPLIQVIDLVTSNKPSSSFHEQQLLRINTLNQRIIQKLICAICLSQPSPPTGSLHCGHLFCLPCIQGSSRYSSQCPYCRAMFTQIISQGRSYPVEIVHRHQQQNLAEQPCYICGRNDRHDQLLVCDLCEYECCHASCDPRLDGRIPAGNWYCTECTITLEREARGRRQARSRMMRNLMTIYRLSRRNN